MENLKCFVCQKPYTGNGKNPAPLLSHDKRFCDDCHNTVIEPLIIRYKHQYDNLWDKHQLEYLILRNKYQELLSQMLVEDFKKRNQ